MSDKEPYYEEFFNCVNMPSCSMDDLLKDYEACMHTHTCNPPVADLPHTHTCSHVHTKVLSDDKVGVGSDDAETKSKKSNKEATAKYRARKKVQSDFLEMQVNRLEAENQELRKRLKQLRKRLKRKETKNVRFTCLLTDIRGRIEGEIGSFPSVNPNTILPAAYVVNPCNMQGNDKACCLQQGGEGETPFNGCEFQPMQCFGFKEPPASTTPTNT